MISAPQSDIVKRRLKGKVQIRNGGTAKGTSALGAMPWSRWWGGNSLHHGQGGILWIIGG